MCVFMFYVVGYEQGTARANKKNEENKASVQQSMRNVNACLWLGMARTEWGCETHHSGGSCDLPGWTEQQTHR